VDPELTVEYPELVVEYSELIMNWCVKSEYPSIIAK
jgi:hypothetical protein